MRLRRAFTLFILVLISSLPSHAEDQTITIEENIFIELPDGKGKLKIPAGFQTKILGQENNKIIIRFINQEVKIPIDKTNYRKTDLVPDKAKAEAETKTASPEKKQSKMDGFGHALKTSGENYITFSSQMPRLDDITVEAWIHVDKIPTDENALSNIVEYGHVFALCLRKQKDNSLSIFFYTGSGKNWKGPRLRKANIPINEWLHVAAVWDSETKKTRLYYNAKQVDGHERLAMPRNERQLSHASTYLHKKQPRGDFFSYQLDEVRIWDRALTQTEIKELFQTPLTGKEAGLIGYYNMDLNLKDIKKIPNLASHTPLDKTAVVISKNQDTLSFQKSLVPDPTKRDGLIIKEPELISESDFIEKEWDELSNRDISDLAKRTLEEIHPDRWKHGETRHFIVHYVRDGDRIARRLEESYNEIREFMEHPEDLKGQWKSHVFATASWDDWKIFQKIYGNDWMGGLCSGQEFYFPGRDYSGKFDVKGKTLTHEMVHLVMNRHYTGRLASWLNEGIAEYFSESQKMSRTQFRAKMARNRGSFQLKEFASNDYHFINLSSEQVSSHYAESAMLLDFLIKEHGNKKIRELVDYNILGGEFAEASTQIFGYASFADLEKEYQKYKNRIK
ncbi:MAG: LamG-like jellyroll fold domain-containing protein [Verrucomicrobiota bacterium]